MRLNYTFGIGTESDRNITETCSVFNLEWQVKFLRTTCIGWKLCLHRCMFSGSQFVVMDFGICSAKRPQSLSLVQFWNICFWRHIIWLITAHKLLCYYWAKVFGFLVCSFVISLENLTNENSFHKIVYILLAVSWLWCIASPVSTFIMHIS